MPLRRIPGSTAERRAILRAQVAANTAESSRVIAERGPVTPTPPSAELAAWRALSPLHRFTVQVAAAQHIVHLWALVDVPRLDGRGQVTGGAIDFEVHGYAGTRDRAVAESLSWWARRAELEPAQDAERARERERTR